MIKKTLIINVLAVSLLTGLLNAKTLPEENKEQIVVVKKALVKLINERELILRQCSVNKKEFESLKKEIAVKEKELNKQKKYSTNKSKINLEQTSTKPLSKKSKNKTTETMNIDTNRLFKYKTFVLKKIYKRNDFGSKKVGSLRKNEVFTTSKKVGSKDKWIFVNNKGWIHINKKIKNKKEK